MSVVFLLILFFGFTNKKLYFLFSFLIMSFLFIFLRDPSFGRDYSIYLQEIDNVRNYSNFSNDIFINILSKIPFFSEYLLLNILIAYIQIQTVYILLRVSNNCFLALTYLLVPYGYLASFDQIASSLGLLLILISTRYFTNNIYYFTSSIFIFIIQPLSGILYLSSTLIYRIISSCGVFKIRIKLYLKTIIKKILNIFNTKYFSIGKFLILVLSFLGFFLIREYFIEIGLRIFLLFNLKDKAITESSPYFYLFISLIIYLLSFIDYSKNKIIKIYKSSYIAKDLLLSFGLFHFLIYFLMSYLNLNLNYFIRISGHIVLIELFILFLLKSNKFSLLILIPISFVFLFYFNSLNILIY